MVGLLWTLASNDQFLGADKTMRSKFPCVMQQVGWEGVSPPSNDGGGAVLGRQHGERTEPLMEVPLLIAGKMSQQHMTVQELSKPQAKRCC